jgi:hypothetical protein
MNNVNLNEFLTTIASDHQQFEFPIQVIQQELTIMYLDKDDFDNGLMKAYHKLRRKYNEVLANIFITTLELKFNIKDTDFRKLTDEEYQNKLDEAFQTLSNLVITRIEKRSSDGEMLTTMASQ